MRFFESLAVHHSASPLWTKAPDLVKWHTDPRPLTRGRWKYMRKIYASLESLPASVRGREGRGWDHVGYHWAIERDGRIVAMLNPVMAGYHALRMNANTLAVCVVGNNEKTKDRWRAVQLASLLSLVDALIVVVPDINTAGHRDLAPGHTACPGLDVGKLLASRRLPWAA